MAAPAVNNIQTASDSITLAYTVPTVTDGRLVVMVGLEDVGDNNPITGVTFGAAALTQDADAVSVVGSNSNRMAIWSLASPTAGSDTITISASNERIGIIAFTLSDCGAKTDSDTDVITSSGSTMTTDVTTVGADNIVVSCTNNSTTSATTNPAGTTSIANVVASATVRFQSFYEDVASAGLVSSTATGFDLRSAMATVSYAPSGGGGGVSGSSAFDISKPTFASSGSATLPQPSGAVSYTITKPVFSATGEATAPNPTGSISFTIIGPVFSSSGAATLPQPSGAASFNIGKPTFAATGEATVNFPVGAVSFSIDGPLFSGSGGATLPQPSGDVAFSISEPVFLATGSARIPIVANKKTYINRKTNVTHATRRTNKTYIN